MAEEANVPQANDGASARMMQAARLKIDPFDEAFLSDPYAYHDALREAGPVVWLESLGVYGLATYAPVQAALRDHETFCSGRAVGLADFAMEAPSRPPLHRKSTVGRRRKVRRPPGQAS